MAVTYYMPLHQRAMQRRAACAGGVGCRISGNVNRRQTFP